MWSSNRKSPRPRQTLRITPATHPRQFPRPRGNVGLRNLPEDRHSVTANDPRPSARVLGVKRSLPYYREYVSGRFHACGLASDPISFASQRRDPLAGSPSRQVFWLMVHPTPRAFPSMNRTVAFTGFVPIYSGGTARDLHPLPLLRSHIVGGTLGDREEGCQVH